MAALVSVWVGLATLGAALVMLCWRPAFTDTMIWLVLWLGTPGTMCIAGLVLWSYRKRDRNEAGVAPQRLQCKVAIGLAITAALIVYALVMGAQEVPAGLLDRRGPSTMTSLRGNSDYAPDGQWRTGEPGRRVDGERPARSF